MTPTGLLPQELIRAWEAFKPYLDAIYPNLSTELPSLLVMLLSIVVYSILVYHFYRFLAKRDVFKFHVQKFKTKKTGFFPRLFNTLLAFIEYGLFFPIIVFLWFGGFSLMLFLLAKNIGMPQILLVSVVFVTAIRVVSYYTEDLARDLAKLIPLVLLGIVIIDPVFFSVDLFFERVESTANFLPKITAYFVFIIAIEWFFRILLFFKHLFFSSQEQTETETKQTTKEE